MNTWKIEFTDWKPSDHATQEALCALGNRFFVTRGVLDQEKDNAHNYPGTYLAGSYNRMKSKVKDKIIENEDIVNWPNWLYLAFRIENNAWFDIQDVEMLDPPS